VDFKGGYCSTLHATEIGQGSERTSESRQTDSKIPPPPTSINSFYPRNSDSLILTRDNKIALEVVSLSARRGTAYLYTHPQEQKQKGRKHYVPY
jgi:hypothetical protein